MSITKNTTIEELCLKHKISFDTFKILTTANFATVGQILEYVGSTEKLSALFSCNGMLYKNYQELTPLLIPLLEHKALDDENATLGTTNNNKTLIAQPTSNISIEEMSKKSLIPSEAMPIFEEAGLETFADIQYFKTVSNTYRKYIKIRLGLDKYEILLKAMNNLPYFNPAKKTKAEKASSQNNDDTKKRTNTKLPSRNIPTQLAKANKITNVYLTTTIEELYGEDFISRKVLYILQRSQIHNVKELMQETKNLTDFSKLASDIYIDNLDKKELHELVKGKDWLKYREDNTEKKTVDRSLQTSSIVTDKHSKNNLGTFDTDKKNYACTKYEHKQRCRKRYTK